MLASLVLSASSWLLAVLNLADGSAFPCRDTTGTFAVPERKPGPFALRGFSSISRRLKAFLAESLNLDRLLRIQPPF